MTASRAVWKAWCEYYGETARDAVEVYAHDAEEAAEQYAKQSDEEGDYDIVGGSPRVVTVVGTDGQELRFSVEGEAVPSYSARPFP